MSRPQFASAQPSVNIEQDLESRPRPGIHTRLSVRDAAVTMRSFLGRRRFKETVRAKLCAAHVHRSASARAFRKGKT